jgi:hypothetical protein
MLRKTELQSPELVTTATESQLEKSQDLGLGERAGRLIRWDQIWNATRIRSVSGSIRGTAQHFGWKPA